MTDLTPELRAIRLALQILDDDLGGFESDTPPARYEKRGFVCLDDLGAADHYRWQACENILKALSAIKDVLPAAEWEETTYETTQRAVDHFRAALEQQT